MTAAMILLAVVAVALAVTLIAVLTLDGRFTLLSNALRPWGRTEPAPRAVAEAGAQRILFPFLAPALSRLALEAALRLARAEDATLLPVFLAIVPQTLPMDAPLPRQSGMAVATQEAIEQRAAAYAVPVEARVERGRTGRHALRAAIENERFDLMVIAAASPGAPGFAPDDVAWLLSHAPGEIFVLRAEEEDPLLEIERSPVDGRRTIAVPSAY
jgi:nucleotide-binding universal stress UspA family protein